MVTNVLIGTVLYRIQLLRPPNNPKSNVLNIGKKIAENASLILKLYIASINFKWVDIKKLQISSSQSECCL